MLCQSSLTPTWNCSNLSNLFQSALGFLVGEEAGDTVDSCSGGLLGTKLLGKNLFTYKIPVIGISACDSAGYLKVVVDAVDKLVNDCPECDDESEESSGSFQALELKLESLLQGTCSHF